MCKELPVILVKGWWTRTEQLNKMEGQRGGVAHGVDGPEKVATGFATFRNRAHCVEDTVDRDSFKV
jgi:hypothetical protein